jgi:hypothetical protein
VGIGRRGMTIKIRRHNNNMDFFEALRFCWQEDLPIKRINHDEVYEFAERAGRIVFVDQNLDVPPITADMVVDIWEMAEEDCGHCFTGEGCGDQPKRCKTNDENM